ncbi:MULTISPECIES: cytochrome P450 [unclassified Crossiella]|uniref:cytochrome P450 family protein n=1 Tax=unclassified Crossiella TaxID=2620835 RepID=UPI001FFE4781|nr:MULTISPECIES: cytochrome P450 [unclassified Crossiella]MCK2240294.1 cytochrome P450 [Crossiella sp. S99.2]MCK2253254.1 cytochrome P450 [Crossiella sp. S99.1]
MVNDTAAAAEPLPDLAMFDQTYMRDPYPIYAKLRQQLPVHKTSLPNRSFDMWVVTRYEDVKVALTSPAVSKDSARLRALITKTAPEGAPQFAEALGGHMLNSDPPQHTRLRKLVAKAFTPRRVEQLRPRIEQITTELLDQVAAGGEVVDLMETMAFPLPVTVICELLGVPEQDQADFRRWSNSLLGNSNDPQEQAKDSQDLAAYLVQLIETKRVTPTDDLLSDLIQASDDDDSLTQGELVAMAFLLLVAGHETTANLIGNGVRALLTHPEQLAELKAKPERIHNAIEELLRYDGPVITGTIRMTTEPLTLGEVTVPADQLLLVGLGSANRDSNKFENADELDLDRVLGGHFGFGHGIHYCVGAPLARLEAVTAIGGLLARFPEVSLAVPAAELNYRSSVLIRSLVELPVRPNG